MHLGNMILLDDNVVIFDCIALRSLWEQILALSRGVWYTKMQGKLHPSTRLPLQ